jgi:hypothetical protein
MKNWKYCNGSEIFINLDNVVSLKIHKTVDNDFLLKLFFQMENLVCYLQEIIKKNVKIY